MMTRISFHRAFAVAACACAALACNLGAVGAPPPTAASVILPTTAAPAAPSAESSLPAGAPTQGPAASPTIEPPTATSSPTSLRGTVQQRSNCRYGPGAFYLYKIGLLAGAPIEVLGRNAGGGWAYAQYVGTHNQCWVNAKQIQVDGDLMSLQDYYPGQAALPMNSKYGPSSILSVSGAGASVTVEWAPVVLPDIAMPGGAGETEYVIEVWTCRNGGPGFYTLGTNETSMTFEVDDSCGQTSHANLVVQNKLGVSGVTPITLP